MRRELSNIKTRILRNWFELLVSIFFSIAVFVLFSSDALELPLLSERIIELGALAILAFTFYIVFSKKDVGRERLYIITASLLVLLTLLPLCVFDISSRVVGDIRSSELTSMAIDYCAIIASAISIIFVVITLVLQREQLNRSNDMNAQMIDNQVLSVIDKFLAPDMLVVRDRSSQLRDNLRFDRGKTVEGLVFAFERQIRDDYYKNRKWCEFKESEAYIQYAAFTRLMRFFDMISLYKLSDTTAKSVHFYYVWWRSFMIDVKDIFVEVWDSIPADERQLSFMPNWVYTIDRLDKQLRDHKLPLE